MAFVKLDTGILNSTLWFDRGSRDVFITALLMAVPKEISEPMAQLEVRSLKETGFVVPPGWYGFVPAAGIGICRQAMIDAEEGLSALERCGSPDPESRSHDFEGRRLVRVDGGFVVLNYVTYREKDHTSAERQRRFREKMRNAVTLRDTALDKQPSSGVSAQSASNAVTSRNITHAYADADVEAKTKTNPPLADASVPPLKPASGVKAGSGVKKASAPAKPDDVEQQVWDDWLAHRRKKQATVSPTVLDGARDEAAKAGIDLNAFLKIWCTRGTQGLKAEWLTAEERGVRGRAIHEVEPEWRRKQRERTEAFIGKSESKQPINMGEIFDVTATKLG